MVYDVNSNKWQWTSESVVMAILAAVLALFVAYLMLYMVRGDVIAGCAVGHDESLRETVGIAEMQVHFKDGSWDSIFCAPSE